jgi:hypothetical protein
MSERDEGIIRSMMGGPDAGWFQPGTATWLTNEGQKIGGALEEARQAREAAEGKCNLSGCAARRVPLACAVETPLANHEPSTLLDHEQQTRLEEWFAAQLDKAPSECDIPAHLRPPPGTEINEYLRIGRKTSASDQTRSRSSSPETVIGISEPSLRPTQRSPEQCSVVAANDRPEPASGNSG